jgi:hypothetical protein
MCLFIIGYPNIAARISVLFFRGSPTTIPRLVVAVVVNTINRVLGAWARPHVRVEFPEIIPSRTNGDTTPAVILEFLPSRVVNAAVHRCPALVFRAFMGLSIHPVFGYTLKPKASARRGFPSIDMVRSSRGNASTLAATFPLSVVFRFMYCDYGQEIKSLTNKIRRGKLSLAWHVHSLIVNVLARAAGLLNTVPSLASL